MMIQPVRLRWLLSGDIFVILVVTMIGFLSHYGAIQNWRWITTFLPLLVAWWVIAPWLGVYRLEITRQPGQIWRPVLAALLAAPLAATIRGFWLNAAITPVFVVVLGLTSGIGFLIWRLVWAVVTQRFEQRAG